MASSRPGPDPGPPLAWPALAAAGEPVRVAETHSAVLFLTGSVVVKVKKPVRFDFLDFSTPELRAAACAREVELNRRLAPDVYLGVSDLAGPDGTVWEHAVVMRRLPAEASLEHLVRHRLATEDMITAVAEEVAAFHASAHRGPEVDAASRAEAVRALWASNLDEMARCRSFDPERLASLRVGADRYLAGRASWLDERIAAGAACDGHGDLLAADIYCLDDGPRILDCIEFDDRYRYGDVVADLAFLVMDLERLGDGRSSQVLVRAYEQASGVHLPRSLLDHWIAYRALVRAKVAGLRADQETDPERDARDRHDADDLLDLCSAHLERSQVRLVVVGGLPGTGKTTLARELADRLRADDLEVEVLRSDVVRKELVGLDPTTGAGARYGQGLYDPAHGERTYDALLARAGDRLAHGVHVVLDASWSRAADRQAARRLAAETGATLLEVCCELDPDQADDRLRRRAAAGGDASDASPEVAHRMRERFDPWPEALGLDMAGAPGDRAAEVVEALAVR